MLKEKMTALYKEIEKDRPVECSIKEDGYCIFNLAEQWNQVLMSKDFPRFSELKKLVLSLAEKASEFKSDKTAFLYSEPEWKELCKHRGPVEAIAKCTCIKCSRISYSFGTSGFLNIVFFVNESEKTVIIEDPFVNYDPPEGFYRPSGKCPFCGGEIEKNWNISPYALFQQYRIIKINA